VKSSVSTIEAVLESPFKIDSVAQTGAPPGCQGPWCQYVISQGTNTITGLRAGTRAEVDVLVGDMVTRLNERRRGKAQR
jgi:hypothetical protein